LQALWKINFYRVFTAYRRTTVLRHGAGKSQLAETFKGVGMREQQRPRSAYRHFQVITTRWMDNDVYGHVNNVVYYSWFDTVVNQFLVEQGVLDIERSNVIGLVIETQCNYFAPLAFPDQITAGIRVAKLGNSSVRYEVGIFKADEPDPAAQGHFVHVYVDRASRRPTALPEQLRKVLEGILAD
jgi:acyl-CoA thioester hydrolase